MGRPKYWDGTKWVEIAPSAQEFDEHKADDVNHVRYGSASGTNAKTITLNPAPTSLVEGFAVSFKNVTENTGAVTLNINGLGAKSVLKPNGSTLTSGNLKAGSIYTVRYSGTAFILQGEGGEYGNATPADVLQGVLFGTEEGIKTGTLSPGKKWASGTAVVNASRQIVVNGLSFRPSTIIIMGSGFSGDIMAVYSSSLTSNANISKYVFQLGSNALDAGSFSITTNGFTKTMWSNDIQNGYSLTWIAFE